MPSSHLILCHPLLLLPPIPPSIRVFSNESTLHMRWPKYWSFSFSIIPSNEHPGLISFRMDRLEIASVMSNSLRPYGLQPTRLLCPQHSPGKNTEVGCHALLQGSFLTRDRICLTGNSCTAGRFFSHGARGEAPTHTPQRETSFSRIFSYEEPFSPRQLDNTKSWPRSTRNRESNISNNQSSLHIFLKRGRSFRLSMKFAN